MRTIGLAICGVVILAAIVFAISSRPSYAAAFVVTKTADTSDGACDSDCSLREAIAAANNLPGLDTINFNIPGAGVHTIQPNSTLPIITDPVVMDGYSQPGSSPNTNPTNMADNAVIQIEIDGRNTFTAGIRISAGNSVLRGLVINRINGSAIFIEGSSGNSIEGNYIGVDPTGTMSRGNFADGVLVSDSSMNVIGGPTPGSRNLISRNRDGIRVSGAGAVNNHIEGNFIGLSSTGQSALGNSSNGIMLFGPGNTVGGSSPAERNVIAGSRGIQIFESDNVVTGNYIGTNAGGTTDLTSSGDGVAIIFGSGNVVGTAAPGEGNLISGMGRGVLLGGPDNTTQGNLIGTDYSGQFVIGGGTGIQVAESGNTVGGDQPGEGNVIAGQFNGLMLGPGNLTTPVSDNVIQGNKIGTDRTGVTELGNNSFGISVIVANSNLIGGATAGAGNLIAGNFGGIAIDSSIDVNIRRNSIHDNIGLGIDLDQDGLPAPNDPGDADRGANHLQNFPDLMSAIAAGGTLTVVGSLNSMASSTYTIEFFANRVCDESGHGEGATYLGTTDVTTDGTGTATYSAEMPSGPTFFSREVTATASDTSGNTSEFSSCVTAEGEFSAAPVGGTVEQVVTGAPEGTRYDVLRFVAALVLATAILTAMVKHARRVG